MAVTPDCWLTSPDSTPPLATQALDARKRTVFRGGTASVWNTPVDAFLDLGPGCAQTLTVLRGAAVAMWILCLCTVPCLFLVWCGAAAADASTPSSDSGSLLQLDLLGASQLSAMSLMPPAGRNGSSPLGCHGGALSFATTYRRAASFTTLADLVGTVAVVFAFVYVRNTCWHLNAKAQAVQVTPRQYAVFVRGLPRDATKAEVRTLRRHCGRALTHAPTPPHPTRRWSHLQHKTPTVGPACSCGGWPSLTLHALCLPTPGYPPPLPV